MMPLCFWILELQCFSVVRRKGRRRGVYKGKTWTTKVHEGVKDEGELDPRINPAVHLVLVLTKWVCKTRWWFPFQLERRHKRF